VFYFADSMHHVIYAYDYDADSGTVTNRREFAKTEALGGIPDGATVDRDGRLWCALCNAGMIVCYRPNGAIETIIEMPSKLISSVMFGGSRLDQLYCTSINPAAVPAIFSCDASSGGGELFVVTGLGVTGLPERRFAG
jgi:sugar lactone lactonase YvrE